MCTYFTTIFLKVLSTLQNGILHSNKKQLMLRCVNGSQGYFAEWKKPRDLKTHTYSMSSFIYHFQNDKITEMESKLVIVKG